MIWLLLVLAALIAGPLVVEYNRRPMDDIARGAASGSFVELSHGTTHYEWFGPKRGPVAICVHGLTTPAIVWRGLVQGLGAMGFRVLTYDLYGRGYSDRPTGVHSSEMFIQQLDELLAHEGVSDDLTLIGYSMGGAVATVFAAHDPTRIRQLILLAPAGMGVPMGRIARFITRTPVVGDWLMLALYPRIFRNGIKAEMHLPSSVEDIYARQEAQLEYQRFIPSVLGALRGVLSTPLHAEHHKLHDAGVPVLAIWGRDDTVIPMAAIGTLTEWSRNSRQEVIDDAGHGLPYTHSDQVLALLRSHLRGDAPE